MLRALPGNTKNPFNSRKRCGKSDIRERVQTFIAEVESPHSELVQIVNAVHQESPMKKNGKIFIGHGRSEVWRVLKD
jgi:hypothetical protein